MGLELALVAILFGVGGASLGALFTAKWLLSEIREPVDDTHNY